MFKKKIAALTAILTALGCLSASVSAYAAPDYETLYEALHQLETEEPIYSPIIPADGIYYNYVDFDYYEGIVVRCTEDDTELETVEDRIQSRLLSGEDDGSATHTLHSALPTDDLRVISTGVRDLDITALLSDSRYEVVGVMRTHWQKKAYVTDDSAYTLLIVPAEGYELDPEMLDTDEYGHITKWYDSWRTDVTPEEAVAYCEKLTALDEIEYAWLAGTYTANLPAEEIQYFSIDFFSDETPDDLNGDGTVDVYDEIALARLNADKAAAAAEIGTISEVTAGDLNDDGKVDIMDAIMMARLVAEDTTLTISETGLAAADFNGDGLLDSGDLTALLGQLAG